jgi:hypothetical protein
MEMKISKILEIWGSEYLSYLNINLIPGAILCPGAWGPGAMKGPGVIKGP